jgi:hypothetical protein
MIQRMLAARSTWDALMGLVFAQFINFLRPLVTCFLGLVVYHWIYVMHQHAPLEKPDLAFTFALGEFAPAWGVRGIVVAGLIAAVMAALSAQVNSASTLFSTDIYKKLIHKEASDHEMVRVGRIASIRHQEALNAAKIIGAELIRLGFDDEFLLDSVETRHAFIEAFRQARPDVIFCHWREDYNPDHSISGMIADECAPKPTALRPSKPRLWAFLWTASAGSFHLPPRPCRTSLMFLVATG